MRKNRTPLLVACNKNDLPSATPAERVKALMTKEIDLLRKSLQAKASRKPRLGQLLLTRAIAALLGLRYAAE